MPPVEALKGVSFELPSSGLVFILGKSGCGKTTLMNIIGGLDGFDEGDVTVDGKSLKSFTEKDYDDYRNRRVGFVFQENNLFDEYTVEYNVSMALLIQGEKEYKERVKNALKAVEMEGYEGTKPNRLSGGQKQRVAIARAIVKQPELLLCDEPTGALDSETGETIFELLKGISKNTLVVVVSHDRESAEKYGDRIIELKSGQVISDRTASFKEGENSAKEDIAPVVCADKAYKSSQKSRGGFPAKSLFRMGAGMLVARPVRLAIALFICIITFLLLGIADTVNDYSKSGAMFNTMNAYGDSHVAFTKQMLYSDGGVSPVYFGDADLNMLQQAVGDGVRLDVVYNPYADYFNEMGRSPKNSYFDSYGFVEADEQFLSDYNFGLVAGRLPQADDEAVISLYTYTNFKNFGYVNNGTSEAVSDYSDIIYSKGINERVITLYDGTTFKITGIVDTHFNFDIYGDFLYDENYDGADVRGELGNMLSNGVHSVLFLREGYYEDVIDVGASLYAYDNCTAEVSGTSFNVNSIKKYIPGKGENLADDANMRWIYGSREAALADGASGIVLCLPRQFDGFKDAVKELVYNYAEGHFSEVEDDFVVPGYTDEHGWRAYAEYILVGTSGVFGENMYQPGYDYNYFYEVCYDNFGKSLASGQKAALEYIIFDGRGGSYADELPVIGVVVDTRDYDGADVGICITPDVYADIQMCILERGAGAPTDIATIVSPYLTGESEKRALVSLIDKQFKGYTGETVAYAITTDITNMIDSADLAITEYLRLPFLCASIGMVVVSVLMVMFYISGVVQNKDREIGIMRAIGADKANIFYMFGVASVIFAAIVILFSVVLASVAAPLLNIILAPEAVVRTVIVRFGLRQAAILILVALLSVAAGVTIPIIKLLKKKPVDIIAGRK